MKAVVYKGPYKMEVEQVEEPEIQEETDAIVKITSTSISGSDLRAYRGKTSVKPETILGHEAVGIVDSIGTAVQSIKEDDRVSIPANIACGFCFNCVRGYPNACLTTIKERAGAVYGCADFGQYQGCQTEYIRVPFADFNCLKLPGVPNDQWEDDFLLLSDAFPTGFYANELVQVQAGSTVAIFGAGTVGLMAAYCAILKGASEVYVIDNIEERLNKAKEIGAVPIDFSKQDPVEQIRNWRKSNVALQAAQRQDDFRMNGVMSAIDAVGYEAKDDRNPLNQNPNQIIENLIRVVNPTGKIGIVGFYSIFPQEDVDVKIKKKQYEIPWDKVFEKGIQIGTGIAPISRYNSFLRDLIIGGRAKPSFVVTKQMTLNEAPEAYEKIDKQESGFVKVIFKTGLER